MRPILIAIVSSCWTLACSGESANIGAADSGDSALLVEAGGTETETGTDTATPTDVATDTGSGSSADADDDADAADAMVGSPSCPLGDLLFAPVSFVEHANQLSVFGGYLWIASFKGLARVPLSGGTPVAVSGIGGYPEMHPHGSKLMVVDSFDILDLDPVTLTKTKLFDLGDGSYSNYWPRTALDGGLLFVLRDHPEGSDLARYTVPSGTSESLWHGPKADGLLRAKDRTFVFDAKSTVTVVDPGSGAPVLATDAFFRVRPRASDASAAYFAISPTSSTHDLFRVDNGTATAVPLMIPSVGAVAYTASDGTRLVHAFTQSGTDVDSELTVQVLEGGTWTRLPCIYPDTKAVFVDAIALDGATAYVAVSNLGGEHVFRVKLP